VARSATRHFIVEGIRPARREPARDLVHDLNDFPHDITAVATGGALVATVLWDIAMCSSRF
jgi:hypothetical protein